MANYMNRTQQRATANRTRRNYKRSGGGMKSSILRLYREKPPSTPTRWQLRRPPEPFAHFSDPTLVSDELQVLQYSVSKGHKFRTFPVNLDQDLIDVYRDPYRLADGADQTEENAPLKYADIIESEAAQEALRQGAWIEANIRAPENMYVVEFYILEWYHYVTLMRQGDAVVYVKSPRKDDKTWNDRELCLGKTCKLCGDKWPKVFGKRGWHDFSFNRWWTVIDPLKEVMERFPKEGGYVYPRYYQCPNEACIEPESGARNVMRIMFNDTELDLDITLRCQKCQAGPTEEDPEYDPLVIDPTDHTVECEACGSRSPLLAKDDPDGLKLILQRTHECLHCNEVGYPEVRFEHMWTEEENWGLQEDGTYLPALEEWTTYDIFDHTVTLYKDGEEGRHRMHVTKVELTPEPDPRLFDPKFQGAGVLDSKTVEREIERMKEHLDLKKAMEPADPSEVAEFLEVPNLFDPEISGKDKKRIVYKPRT